MDWIPFNESVNVKNGAFYIITHLVDGHPMVDEAMYHAGHFLLYPNQKKVELHDVTAIAPWPKPYIKGKHEK